MSGWKQFRQPTFLTVKKNEVATGDLDFATSYKFKKYISLSHYVDVCLPACVYGHHVSTGGYGGQKRLSNSLEMELEAFVSRAMWVPRAELGPSVNAKVVALSS